MSQRSSSSKSRFDPEALLDDLEDLDYEPDISDELEEQLLENEVQLPEPSGQEYREESSSTHTSSFEEVGKSTLSIKSFRDSENFRNLYVGAEDGFRQKFASYTTGISNCLDSSEEEESAFSVNDYNQNDVETSSTNFDTQTQDAAEEYLEDYESIPDPNYNEPQSPVGTECELYYDEDSYSETASYENNVSRRNLPVTENSDISQNEDDYDKRIKEVRPVIHQKSRKSLNFTIQVKGDTRLCMNVPQVEKASESPIVAEIRVFNNNPQVKNSLKSRGVVRSEFKKKRPPRKPWVTSVKKYLDELVTVESKDEIIKFCPSTIDSLTESSIDGLESESQRSSVSETVFKMPTPLKRPPSRQKPKSISISVDQSGLKTVKDAEDNSDIISLIASTNIEDDQDDCHERNLVPKTNLSDTSLSSPLFGNSMSRVREWVDSTAKPKVPSVYKGLCFNFFFYNGCRHPLCKNSHLLETPLTKISNLQNLPDDQLLLAYEFAKIYPKFFQKIYKIFAAIFASKNIKSELINMINYVFDENHNFNKTECMYEVLSNLQKTDLDTFDDAVEFVLLEVGLRSLPGLGEVLIDVISVMKNLPSHWPIIRKLFRAGVKISTKVATRFLLNLIGDPIDHKVCSEVYEHISKFQCFDLSAIDLFAKKTFIEISTSVTTNERSSSQPSLELKADIGRKLTTERQNFEITNSKSHKSTDSGSSTVPVSNSFLGSRFKFGEATIVNPISRSNDSSLNFIPPSAFGAQSNSQLDFGSLSRENVTSTPPNFAKDLFGTGTPLPSFIYTQPPPNFNRNNIRDRSSSSMSSADEDSTTNDNRCFENNFLSNKRKKPNMVYNREGLEYDPANDYHPPVKKVGYISVSRLQDCDERMANFKKLHTNETNQQFVDGPNRSVGTGERSDFVRLSDNQRIRSGTFGQINNISSSRSAGQVNNKHGLEERSSDNRFVKRAKRVEGSEFSVSSNSEPQIRNEKPPEQPTFGNCYFDPNYEFNVSLHNLYLQKIDNVDIDEEDVHRLNDCVKSADGKDFLELINKYRGPLTVQNFISMTLAHLKGMNQLVAKTYKKLLASIEKCNPNFYGSVTIRVILEVITMNLLFELEKRNQFEDAKDLLIRFSNWDSLVTSRLFITDTHIAMSIVGRYLFIAKMLIFTKPELTYEILVSPNFHFLDENHKWPYHPPCPIPDIFIADSKCRNIVIANFLKSGYLLNTLAVTQLYKVAFKRKGGIWHFDVRPFINPMIIDLINKELIVFLKQIFNDLSIFVNYMERDTLRAFLITMSEHLKKQYSLKLFEKCVARNVYPNFIKGQILEHNIEIRTNMLQPEIELIILYYFHKLEEIKNLPPGSESLTFEIKLPGETVNKDIPLLNNYKSLVEVKQIIKFILMKRCSIECKTLLSNVVEVRKEELIKYLEGSLVSKNLT